MKFPYFFPHLNFLLKSKFYSIACGFGISPNSWKKGDNLSPLLKFTIGNWLVGVVLLRKLREYDPLWEWASLICHWLCLQDPCLCFYNGSALCVWVCCAVLMGPCSLVPTSCERFLVFFPLKVLVSLVFPWTVGPYSILPNLATKDYMDKIPSPFPPSRYFFNVYAWIKLIEIHSICPNSLQHDSLMESGHDLVNQ